MASELIHLKSKMLVNDQEVEETPEEEFAITSEEDLKRKILKKKTEIIYYLKKI